MKKRLATFMLVYIALIIPMILGKIVFLMLMGEGNVAFYDVCAVIFHGLSLDLSIAGYVMTGVGLLLVASIWTHGKWLRRVATVYFALAAVMISVCIVLNLALYGFWQFPLDVTPFFYFFSSPADALASVSVTYIIMCVAFTMLLAAAMTLLLRWIFVRCCPGVSRRPILETVIMMLLTATMFIPIRGGVTVSTMNTGKAYFSEKMLLNHAAVNPVLSLMESLLKEGDFGSQYRFMSEAEADKTFKEIMAVKEGFAGEVPEIVKAGKTPDVILIILEGFSSHLMQSLGGEKDIAVELDSIAGRGLLFTNFYASSFRTDRGLVSILSGFPSQPTNSIMKYPHKTANLPGIAKTLREAGYSTTYYYGGDADFTNMRSYLHNTGFGRIVCDKDFPLSERMSKWGVHDHVLFKKVKEELAGKTSGGRRFCVVQTSSSHEPFDVPCTKTGDIRKNAFCYTDSVVGDFVHTLERSAAWENTLVVIVPDHMGGYPDNIPPTSVEKYKIPLIITGGALALKGRNETLGDQTDMAATLLGGLHLSSEDFTFSKNLLDPSLKRRAYFSFPDLFGWIDEDGTCIYDNAADNIIYQKSTSGNSGKVLQRGKAYLQKIYDFMNKKV